MQEMEFNKREWMKVKMKKENGRRVRKGGEFLTNVHIH